MPRIARTPRIDRMPRIPADRHGRYASLMIKLAYAHGRKAKLGVQERDGESTPTSRMWLIANLI
ncbi:hypothetical protein PAAG_05557 [Paracoccidioides lutzii Pb01]|uniref:Uncharacterized protein n=1 Tax=Paracoccidioides lutzii (strain ATCC MYA-826 / Pb01) TaxID=502779 RepID=C1H464_PARBA|nr:hypothetical protein PAAG_05557 [Paracoccidioides lutzii Pb01]EEH34508.2 hypothetical protein PAAG_05557 [Paracoccidioides lutzii Pb01]